MEGNQQGAPPKKSEMSGGRVDGASLSRDKPKSDPTWQRGDELVDIVDVPLAGVTGHQVEWTRDLLGAVRHPPGGCRRGRRSLVARQV